MTKTIKKFSDLPSWYKLSKYNEAKKLDETGWHLQLTIRSTLMRHLGLKNFNDNENIKKALSHIRENPIIKTPLDSTIRKYAYWDAIELENRLPKYSLGIHTMTINELFIYLNEIDREKREYMYKFWNKIRNLDPDISFDIPEWSNNPVIEDREIERYPLCINLMLPDSILINQFQLYLVKLRKITETEAWLKPSKRLSFKDWIYFGVLSYIDLKIWAKEYKIQIPNRIISEAIFSDGEGGEEIVRKTVAPLAEWLLDEDAHSILAAEAAIKIS